MSENKKREYPGFLLYFDRVEGMVEVFDDEKLGAAFRAMYEYARCGKEPESMDQALAVVWPTLKSMLDRDRENYNIKCDQGAYAAACRVADAKQEPKPDRERFFESRRAERTPVLTEQQKMQEDTGAALRRQYAYTSENKNYTPF